MSGEPRPLQAGNIGTAPDGTRGVIAPEHKIKNMVLFNCWKKKSDEGDEHQLITPQGSNNSTESNAPQLGTPPPSSAADAANAPQVGTPPDSPAAADGAADAAGGENNNNNIEGEEIILPFAGNAAVPAPEPAGAAVDPDAAK